VTCGRPTSRTVLDVRVDVLVETARRHRPPTVADLRRCPRVAAWREGVFDVAVAEAIRRGVIVDSPAQAAPLIVLALEGD